MPDRSKLYILLITGLISLVVGVSSGLLLDLFKAKKPKLEYQIVTTGAFSGSNENIAILSLEIENDGSNELEDLTVQVQLGNAEIRESKVWGLPSNKYVTKFEKSSFSIESPFINPTETLRADLLLTLAGEKLKKPTVEVRAKGIVGTERLAQQPSNRFFSLFSTILSVLIALITAFYVVPSVLNRIRGRKGVEFTASHHDDQRDVAAYVLDINGLHDQASRLRVITRKMSYWSIADDLTQSFLNDGRATELQKLANALEGLLQYAAIAETSCFLINYNLARIYLKLGDSARAKVKLTKAYKENNYVIAKRIAMVPGLEELGVVKK
jgi:hypothetical protein